MGILAKDHSVPFVEQEFKDTSIKGKSFEIMQRHKPQRTWKSSLDSTMSLFFKYLEVEKRYTLSSIESWIRKLKCFTKFITKNKKIENDFEKTLSELTLKEIISYEDYLIQRHNNGEIQENTIYKYLFVVQLFVNFLRKNKRILFDYSVPPSLINQGKRTNAYSATQDIIKLVETTEQYSNFKIRDLCILLLIMELGCRPIEVTRLDIDSIRPSESLITLFCEKSGQRTLKISKDLSKVFKRYLEIRNNFNPNHDSVFINSFGEPLSRTGVSSMILRFNKKAFGKAKINAMALRHTYATNALDNLNDFEEVSKSMGHLHRTSTEYYVHKSVKRLLQNSLPFNPLQQLSKGDESHAH
ncbi:hypothetical protein BKP35_09090 [Anaerobacillus arseniciselenatis]|uniref:Tyr recombinase domain-containing protein n=1 Tax=Anaerobacillus arseniciselenatis TaxID=85682 RepID=A0A1S2LJM0_9BACI|nr:site-specific integrase [Anaerobacillus arseniciselenatis]OIJ12728.1 hypothetical protein BKP35_09090 [Anaerobacillus arseniciselenatis]